MKNIYTLIILAVIGIAILGIVLYQIPSMTLDQIIKNKDCTALSKWEEEHMFDDNLNVSSEQMSAAMSLAAECVGKALGNMVDNSDVSTDTMDPMIVLDEILKKRDCEGLNVWGTDHILINKDVTLNSKQQSDVDNVVLECGAKELEKFLRESNLSTDTTDPMVVLGKILNKRDCDGIEAWLKDYNEYYKDLRAAIFSEVMDFKNECKIK